MAETVEWYGKKYAEIKNYGMIEQVKNHIKNNLSEEQQVEYIKYLRAFCDFPNDFAV